VVTNNGLDRRQVDDIPGSRLSIVVVEIDTRLRSGRESRPVEPRWISHPPLVTIAPGLYGLPTMNIESSWDLDQNLCCSMDAADHLGERPLVATFGFRVVEGHEADAHPRLHGVVAMRVSHGLDPNAAE
jgi:hypothetical protein